MKAFKLMIAMAAVLTAFAACNKEGEDTKKEDPKPELSTACKLTKVTVTSGISTRECTVYEKEKTVDVLNLAGFDMTALKFEIEISEKATTNFDPEKTYDLSDTLKPLVITVFAEDSTVFQDYTFVTRVPDLAFECIPVWEKTAGSMGLTWALSAGSPEAVNGSVAFAGTDKIAFAEGKVFDLTGKKVGDINLTGVLHGKLRNIANDVNGVLIGSALHEEETVKYSAFYAWLDGYDKAPTCIYTNEADANGIVNNYMSCGGDVTADFLLTAITSGRGVTTVHHLWEFHNGDFENVAWHGITTEYVSNDGNWGQMVSPTSGNINGWFVIGDSMGDNNGYQVYTRQGYEEQFMDNVLWGTTWPDGLIPAGVGAATSNHWYGNYSTGHVRGFQFQGLDYVIATTTGWPCTYITIQSMIPETEIIDEEEVFKDSHYLLRTQQLTGSQIVPSSSYVYNPDEEAGYVVTNTGSNVYLFKISGEIL